MSICDTARSRGLSEAERILLIVEGDSDLAHTHTQLKT